MRLSNFVLLCWNHIRGRHVRPREFLLSSDHPIPDVEAGSLADIFWNNKGPVVHKWLHYLPVYERHFAPFVGQPIKFLEIGVSHGGSLQMWRKYFGDEVVLFGIDIDPDCAEFDGQAGQVRIGSQADPEFLESVIQEMGGVDIVLDDGSHDSRHIRASLHALYPKLNEGGLYMIEDLHCSYWPKWSGGYRRSVAFWEDVKKMIDDMHHWYHKRGQKIDPTRGNLAAMHIYDSIVVLEKRKVERPTQIRIGDEKADFVKGAV